MAKNNLRKLMSEEASGSPAPSDAAVKRFFSEIGAELKHQAEFGAHEVASALFTGQAYVQYPHSGNEADGAGVHGESVTQPEVKPSEPEPELGMGL